MNIAARSLRLVGLVLVAAWLTTGTAAAACLSDSEARTALQSGQVVSLAQIIGQIEAATGGKIVGARLCEDGAGYYYRVRVQVGGSVRHFTVDAATGAILGSLISPDGQAEVAHAHFGG